MGGLLFWLFFLRAFTCTSLRVQLEEVRNSHSEGTSSRLLMGFLAVKGLQSFVLHCALSILDSLRKFLLMCLLQGRKYPWCSFFLHFNSVLKATTIKQMARFISQLLVVCFTLQRCTLFGTFAKSCNHRLQPCYLFKTRKRHTSRRPLWFGLFLMYNYLILPYNHSCYASRHK